MEQIKSALVNISRESGPKFIKKGKIGTEEEKNILINALPSGEAKDRAYKLVKINRSMYVSEINFKEGSGKAAIIGLDIDDLQLNPFRVFPLLDEMLETEELTDIGAFDKIDRDQIFEPFADIEGLDYLVASLLLLQRVIVVGEHEEIINFIGSLYEAIPFDNMPNLTCVTLVENISNTIHIQGATATESILQQLDEAKVNSTIVILSKKECFGLNSSPFVKKIAELYKNGEYTSIRKEVSEFLAILNEHTIESSVQFAKDHGIKKADSKLLKMIQERLEQNQEGTNIEE